MKGVLDLTVRCSECRKLLEFDFRGREILVYPCKCNTAGDKCDYNIYNLVTLGTNPSVVHVYDSVTAKLLCDADVVFSNGRMLLDKFLPVSDLQGEIKTILKITRHTLCGKCYGKLMNVREKGSIENELVG